MALWVYLFEGMLNFAVRADDKGRARHSPHLFAVHVLLLHDSERLGHFLVSVGQQGEGEVEFFGEFFLCLWRIGGDAEQHGAGFLNLSIRVAEPARFYGSAWGVRPRIEEENHDLAAQVLQRDFFPVLVLQSEVGRFIMSIHGIFSSDIQVETY